MKHIRSKLISLAAVAILLIPLLTTSYLLFWCPADLSARQARRNRL